MQRQIDVVTCDLDHGGCAVELVKDFEKAGAHIFSHSWDSDYVAEFWHSIGGCEGIEHAYYGLLGPHIAVIFDHVENGFQLAGLYEQGEQ